MFIRLRGATFDPRAGEPTIAAALRASAQAGTEIYLVQFAGPIREEWKAAAEQAGARLYGYIPDYALIARIDAAAVARVRALPPVRWVGAYHPAYRLDPALARAASDARAAVVIQTLPDADLGALAARVAAWGGTVAGRSASALAGYLRVELPSSRLNDLATQPDVLWIAPDMPAELFNDIGGGQIMRASQVRQSLGLYGAGQIVAVADTGLDTGNANDIHADFEGRVVKGYCLGRPDPCDWSDPHAHGTHVAGSVLGSGKASGSNPAAHQYAGSFAGVAPEATLVMQSIMAEDGSLRGIPEDNGDLMRQAYADGARIHTNSWGGPTGGNLLAPTYGGYVETSQQVDQAAWEHKDVLILFAAGNQGVDANGDGVVDPDSIGQPGTAKNVLTVGASENLRPGDNGGCSWGACFSDYGANPIADDDVSDNASGMAAFSSRGPTDDGRIKPDIVAPGTNVVSARSRHPLAGSGWGEYNASYIYEGGTSMATPLAAGAAAVVREWLTDVKGIARPSAALMRALLLNGAADMNPGQYGLGAAQEIPSRRPNTVSGWGRVDLAETLVPAGRTVWFADDNAGVVTGASAMYTLSVGAAGSQTRQPLRVTLAWTDYPGQPSAAKALVNDLDLEIVGPDGTRYVGNQGLYAPGQCLRENTWDACNNNEGIVIPNAAPGKYTIIVHGAQVALGGRQPFALAASGDSLPRHTVEWFTGYLPLAAR